MGLMVYYLLYEILGGKRYYTTLEGGLLNSDRAKAQIYLSEPTELAKVFRKQIERVQE